MRMENYMIRVFVILVVSLLVTLSMDSAVAQDAFNDRWQNGVTEPWWFDPATVSKEEIAAAQSIWKMIEDESPNAARDDWSGDYFIGGDTHGSYLRWSPHVGFVLVHVDKCQAKVMSVMYGRAEASPSRIEFFPELKNTASGHGTAHIAPAQLKFIPVKWRGERFLIDEDAIADFGDYIAGLGKYNEWAGSYEGWEFFVKSNEVKQDASQEDTPIVPTGYDRFMKKPIEAEITAVGSGYRKFDRENDWWDKFVVPVQINAGTKHGVKNKMTFRLSGSKGFGDAEETVVVISVGPRSSKGVVVRTIRKSPCVKISEGDDCESPSYGVITVGSPITTRPY